MFVGISTGLPSPGGWRGSIAGRKIAAPEWKLEQRRAGLKITGFLEIESADARLGGERADQQDDSFGLWKIMREQIQVFEGI